jgi:hypothetical protein
MADETTTNQPKEPTKEREDVDVRELSEGETLLGRLERHKTNEQVASAIALFGKAQEDRRQANKALGAAELAFDLADTNLENADDDADNEVRAISRDAQTELKLSQKTKTTDPDYRVLFPDGTIDIIYLPIPKEIEELKLLEGRIANDANQKGIGRSRLEGLTKKREALALVWKAFLSAQNAVAEANKELKNQRALWKIARRRTRKRIEDAFADDPTKIAEIFPVKHATPHASTEVKQASNEPTKSQPT